MKRRLVNTLVYAALPVMLLFMFSVAAQAAEKVVPGYNILTGNTSAWTCDSMTFPPRNIYRSRLYSRKKPCER